MTVKGDEMFPLSREEEKEKLRGILNDSKAILGKYLKSEGLNVINLEISKKIRKIDELLSLKVK